MSSGETSFKVLQVAADEGAAKAHEATVRPEGSRKGMDKYQAPNKVTRDAESKSLPRKGNE